MINTDRDEWGNAGRTGCLSTLTDWLIAIGLMLIIAALLIAAG